MADAPALLVVGAHPDDCEITAGGIAALTAARGGRVLHVAMTNGDKGHQVLGGQALARRRRGEARAAAGALGAQSIVLDNHDGELMPTLDRRYEVIRIIRDFKPDMVLFPRPCDYHPDHRYTSQLVQDALYMVRVQNVCPFNDRLDSDPVALYVNDTVQDPTLRPDVLIDIDTVYDQKIVAIGQHECQMYEWMPFIAWGVDAKDVPPASDPAARLAFLHLQWEGRFGNDTARFRNQLIATYGAERGAHVAHAEAFQVCELGAPLTSAARERLFPF